MLAPKLIGADRRVSVHATPRHHHALWTAMNELTRLAPMGISGVDMAIVSGEWLGSWVHFRDLLKAEAVAVIMPKITRCGGITGMMKIADMALLENVRVAPNGVGAGIGIVAAVAACAVMPSFLIFEYNQLFNPLRHSVMREAISYRDGVLAPSEGTGLAVTRDESIIARYRVD